jgi:hypothetical protein
MVPGDVIGDQESRQTQCASIKMRLLVIIQAVEVAGQMVNIKMLVIHELQWEEFTMCSRMADKTNHHRWLQVHNRDVGGTSYHQDADGYTDGWLEVARLRLKHKLLGWE